MRNGMEPRAYGIAWYKRSDYPKIREIMEDRENLPVTFDKWQSKAEQLERQYKAAGKTIIRAYIDPDDFVAWCAKNGMHVDANARMRWGNEFVYRHVAGG